MVTEDLFSAAKNFHAEGDIRSAEKHYKQVLRLDPGNSNALYLLAVLLHENGRSIRALSLLRKGLDAVSDPVPLFNLCSTILNTCLLYTSPSPRDLSTSRMPSSA